jgi:hypothetical protein
MKTRLMFGGLLLTLSLGLAGPAFADSTCYVGCTPSPVTQQTQPVLTTPAPRPAPSAPLPFTGLDVIELLAVGVVALGTGGLLTRLKSARTDHL